MDIQDGQDKASKSPAFKLCVLRALCGFKIQNISLRRHSLSAITSAAAGVSSFPSFKQLLQELGHCFSLFRHFGIKIMHLTNVLAQFI